MPSGLNSLARAKARVDWPLVSATIVEPATVALETPLAEVARSMLALGVRHRPVVAADEVIGMVSARDLLELDSATTD